MATTNQTARVLELIKKFNNGQTVCIEKLKHEYLWEGKSEKTIRRDLDVIKEYFPESFELIRGNSCYKAITKQSFDNFMKPEVLSLMVQTFNMASRSDMFNSFDLDQNDRRIIARKINELNNIYEFKNKPFENAKADSSIFRILERSIKNQKCIILEYPTNQEYKKIEVKPYKIIFINENFYLACEVEHEEYEFSMFRISKIKTIEDTKKTFHKNLDIVNFIHDMQTPFAKYRVSYKDYLIDVILEVSSKKAIFFKSKNYLKSQKIIETKENGNIIIKYRVTQELEVEEIIKKWLPYVKVISPISLKNKIEDELKQYLSALLE